MYWSGHMSAAGWILSVVWTLIIIALVVAGIMWLISALGNRENRGPAAEGSGPSARETLEHRAVRATARHGRRARSRCGRYGPAAAGERTRVARERQLEEHDVPAVTRHSKTTSHTITECRSEL